GKRVVVLEAGGACAAQDFTQREIAFGDLYLEGGLCATRDLGVAILAGATLGGGTTVNWSTSFRLPAHVGQEWEAESGVSGLQADLAPHFAALERELGIAQVARHNPNNAVIADGCAALGIHHAAMPRNAPRDCGEGCGYCGFGCAYAKKRSTARALLPDVVANGGSIYARTLVERILFDGRRATGVAACSTGTTGERRFTVRARLVVCAAGALRTPSLLARSGVVHPLLGRRLFLHPVAAAFAEFDRPIRTYLGPMQSAYSDEYAALTGNYGVKIEAAPTHPGLAALALPWRDRQAHAAAMDRIGTMATIFALARDRDPGQVSLDRECTVDYAISPYDAEHLAAGSLALFDIAFAAGATRASSLHNDPIVVERAQWNARRRSELDSQIRTAGFAPNRQPLFSAHQMGTAALGSSPANSVTDPFGRVWNREGLLVADASLFPQSSGVNPMLTIMALARRVANAAS
ncbi:MAG: GMC family oxidoreductase, partial [Candidatus Eremiobacteraeota bacterium]|nr:GMC family oxidoreductase [Candidatus Eremiobacteraeota bacterium]